MGRSLPLLAVLVVLAASTVFAAFERPSAHDRAQALGIRYEEPAPLPALLEEDADFPPLPLPGPHDWLSLHMEPGQSYDAFVAGNPHKPDAARRIIYLLPMGHFDEDNSPPIEKIRLYAKLYYQLEVRLLPVFIPAPEEFSPRQNRRTKNRQLLTRDILKFLQTKLPADGYCLLGVTMEDLYPHPDWNYVFGEASLTERVGVFSFARYDEAFWGDPRPSDHQELMLRRSCKVLTHEIGHMFGLLHCIYYDCVLNGSNHLVETDSRTLQACPVCLRKLHHSIGFDPVARYRELGRFYRREKWFEESDWINRQLIKAGMEPLGADD